MWRRLALLAAVVVAGLIVWQTGAYENFDVAALRELVTRAGIWGPVVFVLLFGLEGFGVPGFIFMLTALAVWPPWMAFLMNWLGALSASVVGFGYARYVGRDFVASRLPERFLRFEERIARRGLQTVIVIRLLFFLSPLAHWALGLSPVSFRTFMLGSAIGFAPAMLIVSLAGRPIYDWSQRQPVELWFAVGAVVAAFLLAQLLRSRRRSPSGPAPN